MLLVVVLIALALTESFDVLFMVLVASASAYLILREGGRTWNAGRRWSSENPPDL